LAHEWQGGRRESGSSLEAQARPHRQSGDRNPITRRIARRRRTDPCAGTRPSRSRDIRGKRRERGSLPHRESGRLAASPNLAGGSPCLDDGADLESGSLANAKPDGEVKSGLLSPVCPPLPFD
jgi:hypothetical protein